TPRTRKTAGTWCGPARPTTPRSPPRAPRASASASTTEGRRVDHPGVAPRVAGVSLAPDHRRVALGAVDGEEAVEVVELVLQQLRLGLRQPLAQVDAPELVAVTHGDRSPAPDPDEHVGEAHAIVPQGEGL